MGIFSDDERPEPELENIGAWLAKRDKEDAGFPVSPARMVTELKIGSFYWVRKAPLLKSEDGRTLVQGEISSLAEPARFTGLSGGSPPKETWDFIGIASEEETAIVIEIGPEIRQV